MLIFTAMLYKIRPSAWFACAALLTLSACGGGGPSQTFDLTAPKDGLKAGRGRGVLVVAEPVALQAIDSNRIIIRARDGSIAYLTDVQWADRLPKLMQARLIETFENARRVGGVARPGERIVPTAQLNIDIRQFGIDEARGEAVVEITARIVNDRSGGIIAAQVFESRVPSGGNQGAGASAALDLAHQAVLRNLVAWASGKV